MPNTESNMPVVLQKIHWRVDAVEVSLNKEISERKDTDKLMFEKFDKMSTNIIYQLCAAILTLIVILAMFVKG